MYINNQILPAIQLDLDMLDGTISKDSTGYQASSIHSLEVVECNWDVSLLVSSITQNKKLKLEAFPYIT